MIDKFREEFISRVAKHEIDLGFPYFNDDHEMNVIEKTEEVKNNTRFVTDASLDIDEVIDILMEMKNKGANRLYIEEESPDQGYIFCGTKLNKIT